MPGAATAVYAFFLDDWGIRYQVASVDSHNDKTLRREVITPVSH